MAISITVPRLGWSMEEGLFGGWLKEDSAQVRPGDLLFRLESDKATEDIKSFDAGILRLGPDGPREGDKVAVGAVIGYLLQPGEETPRPDEGGRRKAENKQPVAAGPAARRLARELGVDLGQGAGSGSSGQVTPEDVRQRSRPAISPRARRVASELGVDWSQLRGSGKTGRIRERDVRAAGQNAGAAARTESRAVPLGPTRRTIAERMLQSVRSTAPVTLTSRADATNLVNLRGQFKAVAGSEAAVPTYTDFLVKLAAAALRQHPALNGRWEADGIVLEEDVHVGIAVDTETGLLVPVLRDAHALGLRQLAAKTRDLAERARQRKLTAAEMQGGTFTVTNLGAFGIDAFTPIINYPEVAVLGIGRIERQPVVVENQIAARDVVTLSLTFDHRLVDGAPAARFLQTLCKFVENPGPCLMP